MMPLHSRKSAEELEAEYMGMAGEAPKKPAKKSAKELEKEYLGDAYSEKADRVVSNPFMVDTPGTALVRNKDRRVEALRADEQFVTLKEANAFLADQFAELSEEIETLRESGLPARERDAELKKLEAREKELKKFSREVSKAEKDPASAEAGYEGSEYLIENPYYQEPLEETRLEPKKAPANRKEYVGDARVPESKRPESLHEEKIQIRDARPMQDEDPMNVEGRRRGRDELYKIRDRLVRERDAVMYSLKHGGHTTNDLVESTLNDWKRTRVLRDKPEVHYPDMFPRMTPTEMARQQAAAEVRDYEDALRKKNQKPVIRSEKMRQQEVANELRRKGESLDRLREYPVSDEGETNRRKGKAMVDVANELEADLAPYKHKNIGEALREILDELDEVQEDILVAERNLKFSESRSGKKSGSSRK
jgi:ElaB/YqjD/DUF883 family membrane-anchored ribosome-binding protein